MMRSLAEAVEKQNEIIKIQSEVIDDLFLLLLQHISAEEADRLPAVAKINAAAKLRETVPGATQQRKEEPWMR